MSCSKVVLSAAVFASIIAVGSASAVCTNASLIGVWGFEVTSRGTGAGVSAGQIVFDGNGNLSGSLTTSNNGTVQQGIHFTGTYSLAKNCTGSIVTTLPGGDTTHVNLVLHNGKKSAELIITDSGGVEWGLALAQGTVTCGLTGIKQTFASSAFGVIPGVARTAGVGQIILDGNGSLSGTLTWSVEGTINTAPITGTYTENADCTGTATITPTGFSTAHWNFVVVKAGAEILLIQTDANTVVNGTMQK